MRERRAGILGALMSTRWCRALHHPFFLGLDLSLRTFSDKLNLALSALPSASALTDTVLLKCSAFNAQGVSNSCILGLKSFSCSKQGWKQG